MFKKILYFALLLLVALVSVVAFNTLTAKSKQLHVAALAMPPLPDKAVEHLQKAIQCQTVSFEDSTNWTPAPFVAFRQLIETAFPLVHSKLSREVISTYSYLYKWEGKNASLAPYIFLAHQDVVPVEESTKDKWTSEPFGGVIKDNAIWGRGAIDNKCNLLSILEASEKLLQQGFQPDRTLYFIFGQDEEIGSQKGAAAIAKLLEARHIKADLILDEGGIITTQKVPGITKPVALLGTAEKGYLSLELSVQKNGGHSSMPESETAIDILTNAIEKVHNNPFPAHLDKATQRFIEYLGPEMKFPNNMAFSNQWLFNSLIIKSLEKSAAARAMIHTTSVTTIFNAGIKDNVVPSLATATINFRLLPNDSVRMVLQRVKEIIADERVVIKNKTGIFAEGITSPVADGAGFQKINQIIHQTYDGILASPFLMIGGTDSRYYSKLSDNIVKFSPVQDPIGFHGIDEHVSLDSYQHSIWFYEQLMREAK
jgi:carboxypeptidase PM20D1